eukprot:5135590-Prymnesium_polylepis.1
MRTKPAATAPPKSSAYFAPHVLHAPSPNGPWEVLDGLEGDSCNNPAVFIFQNGTTLLVCKISEGIRQM